MRRSTALLFFLMAIVITCSSSLPTGEMQARGHGHHYHGAASAGSGHSCLQHERDALLAFKKGITGDPAGRLASWNEDQEDCCRWTGVRCSNQTGHVLGIHLRSPQSSTIEFDDDNTEDRPSDTTLSGQISPSLLSLHHLEHLDLSLNNLSGPDGSLPEFLGLLKNLRYLNLSGMVFSGEVPPQLGNLSKLHYLDLSVSHNFTLTSPIYISNNTDISWLSSLPLRYLDMSGVDLSMTVNDWAHVVNTIPSLKVLRLSSCGLTSANQSLHHLNLTNLEELNLSWNYLDQPIASCWFWNLTSLRYLGLANSYLYGQIPDALGGMMSLHVLDFSIITDYNYWIPDVLDHDVMMANMKNLCNLEILDLSNSYFCGDIIEFLPQCSHNKLKELHLGNNNFTGVLPYNIASVWPSLLILDLHINQFSGHVPSEICMLSNLYTLDLSGNKFTGHTPSGFGMLSNLYTLDLSDNQLTGHIPSGIGMLSNLHILHLSNNQLTGPVPSNIGMLSNLTDMDLRGNNLSGVITHEHLAGLTRLTTIDFSGNALKILLDEDWLPPFRLQYAYFGSCHMGPRFPSWLQSQAGLVELNISGASIFDRLPDWFFTTFSNASSLDISSNGINGTLPADLKHITLLGELYLNSNQLTGLVSRLLLPVNLYVFDISRNFLYGPLSSNFGTPNLYYLSLASNHFTGPIPQSLCQMKYLGQMNLANNNFDGEFPLCFEPGGLRTIILRNNRLSGKFPSSLKTSWPDLYVLDLAWNMFSGIIPMWIGNSSELRILQLSHNMFTERIPSTITRLHKLCQLNLAGNNLSGPIPWHLSNLSGMIMMRGHYYQRPGNGSALRNMNLSVVTKGQERYYDDNELYQMVSIDLSLNQLTGRIPEGIASLDGVINLNLSWNHLSGKIPNKIGGMQSLESLDLSENNIYGEIPQSLSSITYLSYLDLSYNNLTGTIPSGGQLDTLYSQYPFMYNGNVGLCGHPLQKNCSNSSEPKYPDHEREEYDSKLTSLSFGLGVGFVVGIWLVFCVILFKKQWRIAYFRLFDVAFDKVYVFVVVIWARWNKNTTIN